MPTISRLFADYSATALRLFRARAGSRAGICTQFRKEGAPLLWAQSLAAGHWEWLRAALARRAAGSAEDLRARARTWATVSRRRGECLYLRRNCSLNARLCFRGIPYTPDINAPYTRDFGGVSRWCRKSPRKTRAHSAGRWVLCAGGRRSWGWRLAGPAGARSISRGRSFPRLGLEALHRAGDREKPRQASSLSGRVFTWSFSPRQ